MFLRGSRSTILVLVCWPREVCVLSDGDQAQVDMEANQQVQEEVEAQVEDAHGGQSPPQRLTRSMFKALGARGQLFSLFVISLVEGA